MIVSFGMHVNFEDKENMESLFLLTGLVANGASQTDVCHVLQSSQIVGAVHHQAAESC